MAKQKPKPITVEHEQEREFLMVSSPSVGSGVVTPTFTEHVKDLTKSALSPRKRPIMVTNTNLGALSEDAEDISNGSRSSESVNHAANQKHYQSSSSVPTRKRSYLLRSQSNLKRTSTVRRHPAKPSPPLSTTSNTSIPLRNIFKSKTANVNMPDTPLDDPQSVPQTGSEFFHVNTTTPITPPPNRTTPPNLQEYQNFARNLSDHGVPPTPIVAGTSPVMLVRKKTTTRSIRGSPVRRYFRKLFRRKSKAKYNFTKEQLTRQLSFEMVSSPKRPKPFKYTIKATDIFRLHPKVRRTSSIKKNNIIPTILSPKPINPAKSSPSLLQFDEFDYDYRKRVKNPPTKRPQKHVSISEGIQTEPVRRKVIIEPEIIRSASSSPSLQLIPPRRSSKRKSNQSLQRQSSSRKLQQPQQQSQPPQPRATKKYPIIRRIDVYGADDPVELFASTIDDLKGSTFDDPVKLDDALRFVNTWSCYLRRAIAVRVVLRQEIHSWEVEEEKEWRRSYKERRDAIPIPSPVPSDAESLSDHSISSGVSFSDIEEDQPKLKDDLRRCSLKESLDETRISSKYGSLVGSSNVSPVRSSSESLASMSRPGTESYWLSGKSVATAGTTTPRPLPQPPYDRKRVLSSPIILTGTANTTSSRSSNPQSHQRKVSDVIVQDMYREIHELEQRRDELQELVNQNPYERPLPNPPQSKQSQLLSQQQSPAQPAQPPPSTPTPPHPHPLQPSPPASPQLPASLQPTLSNVSRSSSAASELKRGALNRRRPRSRIIDNRRVSSSIESSWSKYDSGSSGGTPKSEDSLHYDNNQTPNTTTNTNVETTSHPNLHILP